MMDNIKIFAYVLLDPIDNDLETHNFKSKRFESNKHFQFGFKSVLVFAGKIY